MTHIGRWPQEPERAIIYSEASQWQHHAAIGFMGFVALTRRAFLPSTGLALPMKECRADRIVAVAGSGWKLSAAFIERASEQVEFHVSHTAHLGRASGRESVVKNG